MPETVTDKTAQAQEPAAKTQQAEPAPKHEGGHSSAAHGGAYALVRELTAAGGGQEPPPDRFAPIFRKAEFSNPVNDAQKARALTALQQQYGNRYAQRVLSDGAQEPPNLNASAFVQRQESHGSSEAAHDSSPQLGTSAGRPLDSGTRDSMGSRFGQDFGGVRVHDDSEAHSAAKSLNAEAFTTGRDIYFKQGAYNPFTQSGQKLLAHELAHVVQQDQGATGAAPQGFRVSHPSDPLERQADAAGEAVMRGEMFPPLGTSTAPVYQRQAAAPAPAPAAPGGAATDGKTAAADFSVQIAGTTVVLPVKELLKKAVPGNKLTLPANYLKKVSYIPSFKLTEASIDLDDEKVPTGATLGLAVNRPPLEGTGSVTVDKHGNATGSAHVVISSAKIPGLKQTELDVTVTNKDFSFDASIDFDLPKVTGNLKYKYADQKHSGKGKANYEGAKLKGELEIIMSEAGFISGSGKLEMELFKGLKGEVDVAVDEKKNIGVKGKLSVPGQIELFPEKKFEKSFFNFEKKFPIWGITIPVIDVNVGIFAEIHAGAGFRSKFGPGVLRDIALTGEFGTDPEAATEFGLGGEFFLPAGAEVVANVGGGIGLGLAVADITGGVEAVGVAGLYSALTVRPNFKYEGGKYTVSGMAEIAGVAQLKFGINAFAKIDVGVWLFKGTVWRKDWTLAEWVWNTGLNLALRANMSYTLGEDFAPDISFETGQVDPEKFIKDVMPESGSPVPAPPKPPVPDKSTLTAEGAQGQQTGAPGEAPAPPAPGSPPAKTQPGTAAPTGPGAPGATPDGGPVETAAPVKKGFSLAGEGHTLTATLGPNGIEILMASGEGNRIRGMLRAAIDEVENDPTRKGNKKHNLLVTLKNTLADCDEDKLHQDWILAGARDPRGGKKIDFKPWADIRLAQIVADLAPLGTKGIKSFDDFRASTPPRRFLPSGYDPRKKLYERGSGWSSVRNKTARQGKKDIKQRITDAQALLATNPAGAAILWNDLLREDKLPTGAKITSFTPSDVDRTSYEVDHIRPLALHWEIDGGNDTIDQDRWDATVLPTKINLITEEANQRKGGMGGHFVPWVLPNFTSQYASGDIKGAREIDDMPFTDAAGNPIP